MDQSEEPLRRLHVTSLTGDGRITSRCTVTLSEGPPFSRLSELRPTSDGGWMLSTSSINPGSSRVFKFFACQADASFGQNGSLSTQPVGDLLELSNGDLLAVSNVGDRASVLGLSRDAKSLAPVATIDFPEVAETIRVLALASSGNVFAGGHANHAPLLAHLVLDPSRIARVATTRSELDGPYSMEIETIAIGSDGRVIAAAHHLPQFVLLGFASDGSADPSFGTNGLVQTDLQEWVRCFAVGDGYIVTGLVEGKVGWAIAVDRYDLAGHKQRSFGVDGRATIPLRGFYPEVHGVIARPDGTYFIGFTTPGHHATAHVAFVHLSANGLVLRALDPAGLIIDPIDEVVDYYLLRPKRDGGWLAVGGDL